MMDLQPKGDGRMHFALGPVERAVVVILTGVLVTIGWRAWDASLAREARLAAQYAVLNDKLSDVAKQQAVQTGQMQTLTTQLADMPRIAREVAEIKVQVSRHEQDIRDINRRQKP